MSARVPANPTASLAQDIRCLVARRQPRKLRRVRALETLTAADFAPLRGDRFRIAPTDAPAFDAELVEVTEGRREPGGRAPFSLVFRGGPTPPLPQRIHRVEHAELGALEIFLVPVGPDRYEAVFT
jgi:hypothetical protein